MVAAAALISDSAPAQPPASGREAAIDFAAEGAISDWLAESDGRLYVMDRTGRWYLAMLDAPCPQLSSSPTIAFEPSQSGRFDRFSAIISAGVRCRVASLVTARRPAAKGGKERG